MFCPSEVLSSEGRDASTVEHGRLGQFLAGAFFRVHMHVMKLTIKGKSDKQAFTVAVSMESLIGFLTAAATKSEEQFDDELATSPGGWPTAIFTAMLPQKAREAVGWDLSRDGWNDEKAMAAFESRLERKQGGGCSIEAKQAAWDKKVAAHAAELEAEKLTPERALELAKKHAGKRPEAKEGKAPTGAEDVAKALA